MNIRDRLRALERIALGDDPFRLLNVPDDADQDEARERYRAETGYRGVVVVMDETDRNL